MTNFRKKIRTLTGGPWWTQIKVALIQKGLLDNQNPGFCMGWPWLYLLDSIEHSRSVCRKSLACFDEKKEKIPFVKFQNSGLVNPCGEKGGHKL